MTGITTTPGRDQQYTVWVRGFVLYFTNDYEVAKKVLGRYNSATIDESYDK